MFRHFEFLGKGGEHHDGLRRGEGFDGVGEPGAAHERHEMIGENEVKHARNEYSERRMGAGSSRNAVTIEFQQHGDGLANEKIVIHEQNMAGGSGLWLHNWPKTSRARARKADGDQGIP